MYTLYDYLPSQNAWKVRALLRHLGTPYRTEYVSIFEGEGQRDDYLAVNPAGAVPALRLPDGRVLAESNAILFYLAQGTRYLPADPFGQAKVLQWMSFEQDYVGHIAGLRHWTMTGKLARRPPAWAAMRRAAGSKALAILDRELSARPFIAGDAYTVADIALFAYAHRADEAGLPLADYPNVRAWIARVRAQEGFLDEHHPYAIDPYSGRELP
ncbi:glutathione S-transferase [Pseudoduganella flava]|uniref:Glutathione S-transferase n=1 Tax=Pseudoduganella flava TaxID=871742 RepID=A0A562PWB9_9BURK|nr:glutathione S-transferase family protein [Pseudoduganella flava]QGZ39790.1 glutathione S-transferase family protein [Pseudoduganella flava]TWI48709.1 glutathione S-transferase [Pseudoduganella flava]